MSEPNVTSIPTENTSICQHCGVKVKADAQFCPYCGQTVIITPTKAFCEEYRTGVNEAAQMDFAPVATTATALPIEPPKAEALDPSTISRILNKASMVKDFIEAVEERAFELLNNGIDIPGYKLVHKRVNRQWIDESSVEIAFGEKAYTKKIKTPAQLEKEVGKEAILDYVTTPEAGLTLVPETDKREKVVPLIEVFDCGTDNQPLDI